MGTCNSKAQPRTFPPETPANYMLIHYGSPSCEFLCQWTCYTSDNSELQWPHLGSFELPKLAFLKERLVRFGSRVSTLEWDAYSKWHFEASKRAHDSEVASLRDLVFQMAEDNRKLKKNIKDLEAKILSSLERPSPSPHTTASESSPHTTASESADKPVKDKAACSPWTNQELLAILKVFPKVTEDPERFADEFKLVTQVYKPGLTHLLQLVHMLVDENQAQHWLETAHWAHLEPKSKWQTEQSWEQAQHLAISLHRAVPKAFPRRADWTKIDACTQKTNESVYDFYNRFKHVFEENFGFGTYCISDSSVNSTFNYLFVKHLTPRLSQLVDRAYVDWEDMPTQQLVREVDKLSRTQECANEKKIVETLSQVLQQLGAPQRIPPGVCHYCKQPGHWKKDCYKLKRAKRSLPRTPHFGGMNALSVTCHQLPWKD